MAKVSKKRIEIYNNYANSIIYRCTHQKNNELKSITDNEKDIVSVINDGLTIICENDVNYRHYNFKVSGNLTIAFDSNINCISLVNKYTTALQRKTLLNNLYSCFAKLVENVTNSCVASNEFSFDFSSVEIVFSQWHNKKKKEPIDLELKDHNYIIEDDLYCLVCKTSSEYNQAFDLVSKWKNNTIDENELIRVDNEQIDFKSLQKIKKESKIEVKTEEKEKIVLTDYAKIERIESLKKVVITIVSILLVCSIVLGVGYGLFALGKLAVDGIAGLINKISFREENTCY